MRIVVPRVTVRVPATSANLGSAFDAAGLALGLHDEVAVEATTGGVHISVQGEGAGSVADGEDHLVVRALRRTLDVLGAPQTGLSLRCTNRIPHGRGLGSSAAATVAGITAARALVDHPDALSDLDAVRIATEFEGHPDNAAAAVFGGAVLSWIDRGDVHAAPIRTAPDLPVTVIVPGTELATRRARALLPEHIRLADAARQAGRSALLAPALAGRTELLLAATDDWLHQRQRAAAMPESVELVRVLRAEGFAAAISGAGPSVIVLGSADEEIGRLVAHVVAEPSSWRLTCPRVDVSGATVW